jgi:hypothetical protein
VPGEPPFDPGATNSFSASSQAGFYQDGFGIVHLQGTVNAPTNHLIFTLPAGFRPSPQLCFAVPTVNGMTLAFNVNRLCILGNGKGEVFNAGGVGTEYISLDGITFRAEA